MVFSVFLVYALCGMFCLCTVCRMWAADGRLKKRTHDFFPLNFQNFGRRHFSASRKIEIWVIC